MQGKDLEEVIQSLRIFNKILVTGPQRSGTTIAAQIIAADSSMPCVDEKEYSWRDPAIFRNLLNSKERLVIQCPNFAHIIEQFAGPGKCIVFMHRDPREIIASQRRIGWRSASYQRKLYRGKVPYLMHLVTPICVIKYLHWHLHQKVLIPHYCDLSYASLSSHPRWIKPVQRSAFNAKQTAL